MSRVGKNVVRVYGREKKKTKNGGRYGFSGFENDVGVREIPIGGVSDGVSTEVINNNVTKHSRGFSRVGVISNFRGLRAIKIAIVHGVTAVVCCASRSDRLQITDGRFRARPSRQIMRKQAYF